MTPRQYSNAVRGYENDRKGTIEAIYDAMRIGTAWVVMSSGNMKKGRKVKPSDIVRLERDGEEKNPVAEWKDKIDFSKFPKYIDG